ncbi:hypothetical protein Pint_32816 [Pistacia integerrima]|uniref:Uncharacterized protein n=1 Tax=Pistacia integerrima TaxID=434235 RepID=A0ACC0X9C9_9ROSI|nr:hypothetical protein Pint_32816 [Pistacia integerrima]
MSACSCFSSQYPSVRCSCLPGYRGNPYLLQGCLDTDECKDNTTICRPDVCENSNETYTCIPLRTSEKSKTVLLLEEKHLFDILDAQVVKQGKREEIMAVANIAKRRLSISGKNRPSMKEVAMELEAIRASRKDSDDQQHYHMRTVVIEPWDAVPASTSSTFDNTASSPDILPLLTLTKLWWYNDARWQVSMQIPRHHKSASKEWYHTCSFDQIMVVQRRQIALEYRIQEFRRKYPNTINLHHFTSMENNANRVLTYLNKSWWYNDARPLQNTESRSFDANTPTP